MGDLEAVINDMNATTPDVIISVLPSPMQEQFLYEHRDKMNANIWYGIGGVPVHKKKARSTCSFEKHHTSWQVGQQYE